MSLKLVQDSFIQQITETLPEDDFLSYLKPCGNLLPEQQLAIYKNNVQGALQKSLSQIYPVCKKVLGEKYFKQIANIYIRNYPSKHYDLNLYGEYFFDFMNLQFIQREELKDFPYLSDLVQLEWFYHQVYFAAQGSVFDFFAYSQLSEQEQAGSVFQLSPCLKFISSDYPIVSIWQLNQEQTDTQQTLSSGLERCCVFRNNNHIKLILIDTKVYTLLSLINGGSTLAELVKKDVDSRLSELIKQGWVDSFKVKHV